MKNAAATSRRCVFTNPFACLLFFINIAVFIYSHGLKQEIWHMCVPAQTLLVEPSIKDILPNEGMFSQLKISEGTASEFFGQRFAAGIAKLYCTSKS
jgi:hypothetical protein